MCNIGESKGHIEDESYDILFSISVVEHVSNELLDNFFKDCHRILKPGGEMIHLIDIYVGTGTNEREQSQYFKGRHDSYAEKFYHADGSPALFSSIVEANEAVVIDDFVFRSEFATNPDSVMYDWRSIAPSLHEIRENTQLCTLLMHVVKR